MCKELYICFYGGLISTNNRWWIYAALYLLIQSFKVFNVYKLQPRRLLRAHDVLFSMNGGPIIDYRHGSLFLLIVFLFVYWYDGYQVGLTGPTYPLGLKK